MPITWSNTSPVSCTLCVVAVSCELVTEAVFGLIWLMEVLLVRFPTVPVRPKKQGLIHVDITPVVTVSGEIQGLLA